MNRYEGRRAIVTGGGSGIGQATVLRMLAEGGIVAALLLVGFLATTLGALVSVRRRGGGEAAVVATAAIVVSTYFFLHASFDWLEEFPALLVPAFALPLVALTATAQRSAARPSGGGARLAAATGIVVVGVAIAVLSVQYIAVRYYERAGRVGAANAAAAFKDLESAAALNPLWIQPYLREGALAVKLDDRAHARAAFANALDVEASWYAHLELGLLEAQVGRFRRARRQLELAADLSAHDEFVTKARRLVRERRRIDPAKFNNDIGKRLQELLGSPGAPANRSR